MYICIYSPFVSNWNLINYCVKSIAWILTVAAPASAHGNSARKRRPDPHCPRQRLTQWNWACPRQTFASAQVVAMLLVGLSQVMGYSVAGPSISVLAKTIQVLLRRSVPTVLSSWSLGCDCPPADLEREVAEYGAVGWRATPLWKGTNYLSL